MMGTTTLSCVVLLLIGGLAEACTSLGHRPRVASDANEVDDFPDLFEFAFGGGGAAASAAAGGGEGTSMEIQQQKEALARNKFVAKMCPSTSAAAVSNNTSTYCQVVTVDATAFESSKMRFPLPLSVMDIDHPVHKFIHRSIVLKKVGVSQSASDPNSKTYSYKYKNQPVIFSVKNGMVFGSIKLSASGAQPVTSSNGGGRLFLRPCPNTAVARGTNLLSRLQDGNCHVLIQKNRHDAVTPSSRLRRS